MRPKNIKKVLQKLQAEFTLSTSDVLTIAGKFHGEILAGLNDKQSSLKMLPTYLVKPSGKEAGAFLAIDFGGTNVRVQLLELIGSGKYIVKKRKSLPLKDPSGLYDYTSEKATGPELFDFIVDKLAELIMPGGTYPLGHTFSFPTNQSGVNDAVLIRWTKEIKTLFTEGCNINNLLTEALKRRNLQQVIPKVIINDTVGTLLTSAYNDPHTDIGSICGTGHNTCYFEPHAPRSQGPMIINLESGNFNKLPFTTYDDQMDRISDKPTEQRLEKMVAGKYIGELVRIIVYNLIGEGTLFVDSAHSLFDLLEKPYSVKAEHISIMLSDNTQTLDNLKKLLEDEWMISDSLLDDRFALQSIASLVTTRSARLVASTYVGIIRHIDPLLTSRHTIAVDGSLYEKMPGYDESLLTTLAEVFRDKVNVVSVKLTKDGSGVGAAIAAAIADDILNTTGA